MNVICILATLLGLTSPALAQVFQSQASSAATGGSCRPASDPVQAHLAAASIPMAQLGAEADKKGALAASSITPTASGARLRALMQDLDAEATPEGLWLTSTADEDAGKANRFRVRAMTLGRSAGAPTKALAGASMLPGKGVVGSSQSTAMWLRPGVIEEYSVSTDGVRQDFVVLERPAGTGGSLVVDLEVTGALAEAADYGARLVVSATGRALAYSRLRVTDATGRELAAHLEVHDAGHLKVGVEDAGAQYPVRIDPTFSDADWVALNVAIPEADGEVAALAVDGSGNLYLGGLFTSIGSLKNANNIAKWR